MPYDPATGYPYLLTAGDLQRQIEDLRAVIANFANEDNWSFSAGHLQWIGKRNPIEYAQSTLEGKR